MALAEAAPAPHVSIRPAQPSDAAALQRWRAEPSVRLHQPLGQLSTADLRADIGAHRDGDLQRGRGQKFQWIVLVDGQPAGWITLVVTNWEHGLAEIGYALSTEFQGRGLMALALGQVLAELFCASPIERLEARCAATNIRSHRLLEGLGFRYEGCLRGYFVLDSERVDNHLYALLRTDYLAALRPHSR
jgi:RimJ/RimL family protein N-acetyltransferase